VKGIFGGSRRGGGGIVLLHSKRRYPNSLEPNSFSEISQEPFEES